jgi:hypothetical protein
VAGVVFRETETVDAGGVVSRQVREVFAAGDDCKVVIREGGDALAPPGSYILATGTDAFLVDPARAVLTPLDPADMEPVSESPGDAAVVTLSDVSLDAALDEAGPKILGLPTRHYVYRLRYQERTPPAAAAPEGIRQWEERHEFWATPWPDGAAVAATWRRLRVADDAGIGWAAPEMRAAIERMQDRGLMLRQIIVREKFGGPGGAVATRERVDREVAEIERRELAATDFKVPSGYAHAEFLAPAPDEPAPNDAPMSVDRPLPAPGDTSLGP